jgi:histidinol-phosphate aminotransferase
MSKFWSSVVHTLTPYVPGEQPSVGTVVKLNTNENPYGPSPRAIAAIRAAANDDLRLYPDPESNVLKAALARHHGIDANRVFVGNGSDEVLAHVFHALLQHELPVLFPDVTYSFYPVYCALYGIACEVVPLSAEFEISPDSYVRPNGGIIFANPNAPTGRVLPLAAIEALIQSQNDSVVVIDEAYVAFGADSAVRLIDRYENLVVVQTLSKSHGLAGLRVGCAFAQPDLIEALQRVKNSFNSYPLDRLAIAGAVAALDDSAYYDVTRHKVIASRERLYGILADLGFKIVPSAANFVFATHPRTPAAGIAAALRERSIFVRHFAQPRTVDYLRISIGTDAELDALTSALKDIVC